MITKFKSLDNEERFVAVVKLVLCFLAGVLSAVLLFELFFAH
jgi:hypothetical protein